MRKIRTAEPDSFYALKPLSTLDLDFCSRTASTMPMAMPAMPCTMLPGMLAADNPVADILPGTDNDANKLYAEAWGKVQSITTLAGKVTIWCTEALAVAFPVQFKVVR